MKLQREFLYCLSLVLLSIFGSSSVSAQSDPSGESSPTRTYAITNATIVQSPGEIIEGGSIVFKNGMILGVGTNISLPGDAQVIDGTDLFVYPGFIDGMSYTGAKRPEQMERPDNLFTPDPPNEYAGITPERTVIEQIEVGDNSIANLRKIGFTTSHSVPYGRMLPGSGSILLLTDADHADDMILRSNVSMYTQFSGAPGAYPGNTLGIMAKWRDLFINARYQNQYAEVYTKNPSGLERPTQDRVLQAFYPVVSKQKPVFYNANSLLEAQRAIRLMKELDFELVLGNLEDAWLLTDQLKESNVKLFMSLDLPDKPKNGDNEDKSDEVTELEKLRMDAYNKYVSQFALLDSLGITYGFSTIDASASKIKANLSIIVEAGLSEDAALSALTIEAARLLGIENVTGTLESGKIANAVISTGPYFEKDTNVKMVFVDGHKYDFEIKEKGEGGTVDAASESALIGSWSYVSTSPQGEFTGKMIFEKEGDEITGLMTSDSGNPDQILSNISFVNGTLSFDYSFDGGGQSIEIVVVGDVTGTYFDGEASVAQFNISFPFSATKDSPNNN